MKPIKNFFSFLHKNSVSGFITMLLVMTTGCAVNMQDYNAALVQSVLDRNNNIIATGYAVISVQKADTPAQQRILSIKASKLDAYKVLMEQVYGQYLDANTTVSEMIVQGVIYGAKLVSITPVGDDTYETTLSLSNSVVDDLRKLYLASMTSQGSFITGS